MSGRSRVEIHSGGGGGGGGALSSPLLLSPSFGRASVGGGEEKGREEEEGVRLPFYPCSYPYSLLLGTIRKEKKGKEIEGDDAPLPLLLALFPYSPSLSWSTVRAGLAEKRERERNARPGGLVGGKGAAESRTFSLFSRSAILREGEERREGTDHVLLYSIFSSSRCSKKKRGKMWKRSSREDTFRLLPLYDSPLLAAAASRKKKREREKERDGAVRCASGVQHFTLAGCSRRSPRSRGGKGRKGGKRKRKGEGGKRAVKMQLFDHRITGFVGIHIAEHSSLPGPRRSSAQEKGGKGKGGGKKKKETNLRRISRSSSPTS